MVDPKQVKAQLKRIGADYKFWGRPELNELPRILFEGEQLEYAINGHYKGGFALLCATDQRVLLVDKKPLYLTLEDIRYEMISDVMFNYRLLDASVMLGTINKTIDFMAYNQDKLREFTNHVQQKVTEFRSKMESTQNPLVAQQQLYQPVVQSMATQPATNPYSSPMIMRKRVSRFY